MPEDPIFKTLLREFLPDFLHLFFPEVAARLDFTTLQFLDREEFTEIPLGPRREVDVLVRVRTLAGDPELILIHIETQGRREREFNERMWLYYALLGLRHSEPVLPLALLVYRSGRGIGWETYTRTLFGEEILRFRFGRVGLLDLRDEDYVEQQNYPLAIALAARMRHPRGSALGFKLRCVERLEQTPLEPARKQLLVQAVDYFLALPPDQEAEFHRLVARRRLKEVSPMLTGSERLGITKGIVQGEQELLLKMVEGKFGKIPAHFRRRIRALKDPEVLTELGLRLLTAESLADLESALEG